MWFTFQCYIYLLIRPRFKTQLMESAPKCCILWVTIPTKTGDRLLKKETSKIEKMTEKSLSKPEDFCKLAESRLCLRYCYGEPCHERCETTWSLACNKLRKSNSLYANNVEMIFLCGWIGKWSGTLHSLIFYFKILASLKKLWDVFIVSCLCVAKSSKVRLKYKCYNCPLLSPPYGFTALNGIATSLSDFFSFFKVRLWPCSANWHAWMLFHVSKLRLTPAL